MRNPFEGKKTLSEIFERGRVDKKSGLPWEDRPKYTQLPAMIAYAWGYGADD